MTLPARIAALILACVTLIGGGALANDLRIERLREGRGPGADNGDQVTVHYDGRLTNGEMFDSSRERGQPFTFTLGAGQVIKGWDMGLLGMKRGDIRRLTIPPSLGYGFREVGSIPANSTLVFDVEMLSVR